MAGGKYRPNDNLAICDISGLQCYMSETVKTWDGLRVRKDFWYPKHPQLNIRAIPDQPGVIDGRPEAPWQFFGPDYPYGSFCLESPGHFYWTFYIADDGALLPANVKWGTPARYLDLNCWRFTVDDDGALHVNSRIASPPDTICTGWKMYTPDPLVYEL